MSNRIYTAIKQAFWRYFELMLNPKRSGRQMAEGVESTGRLFNGREDLSGFVALLRISSSSALNRQ